MNASQRPGRSRPIGKRVAQAVVLIMLLVGAAGITATGPAAAAGTTSKTFNCYTQWWNTAWAQRCASPGATWAGVYTSGISCTLQSGKSLSRVRLQGSTADAKGSDCLFSAHSGWIHYNPY